MPRLKREQQIFIVQRLACYESLRGVAEAFKECYGFEISTQQVWTYDPNRPGYDMAPEWKEVYETTRRQFLEDTASIPIANKSVRLQRYEDLYQAAHRRNNVPLSSDLLERAAKEVGGLYSNTKRHEHTGAGGAPIQTQSKSEAVVTLADIESLPAHVRDVIRAALGGSSEEES